MQQHPVKSGSTATEITLNFDGHGSAFRRPLAGSVQISWFHANANA